MMPQYHASRAGAADGFSLRERYCWNAQHARESRGDRATMRYAYL